MNGKINQEIGIARLFKTVSDCSLKSMAVPGRMDDTTGRRGTRPIARN
jgi:hypothetical protein